MRCEMEDIGERIRRLRIARGWSQDQLARRAGVSRQHVYTVERGKITRMQETTLRSYADALQMKPEHLATGEESDRP